MSDELSSLDPNVQWIAGEAKRPVVMDVAARQRLLDAIRAEPLPQRSARHLAWITESRRFSLPPLATIAMAAGLVGVGVLLGRVLYRDGRAPAERVSPVAEISQLPDSVAARVVKFVLIAPQAAHVAVVGDFNGWDTRATPAIRQKDGTWVTFVSLRPGRHVYSFVVDGTHFVNDPTAPIAPDDGYGQKNSVVVVRGASS